LVWGGGAGSGDGTREVDKRARMLTQGGSTSRPKTERYTGRDSDASMTTGDPSEWPSCGRAPRMRIRVVLSRQPAHKATGKRGYVAVGHMRT